MKNSTSYDSIIAIILASGKGTRFGKPKAEAELGGISFSKLIETILHLAGINNIHTAKGYLSFDMLGTLKMSLQELRNAGKLVDKTGILCFPVDFPLVKADTIKVIAEAHLKKPEAIIRPSYYGFSGHPIIIPVGIDLDADDKGKGLKGIILHSGLPVNDIHVEDEGIHRNINKPEDLTSWKPKN